MIENFSTIRMKIVFTSDLSTPTTDINITEH